MKYDALFIPALEKGSWFLMRIELEAKTIFILDSRTDIIRPTFDLARVLQRLMCSLVKGEWKTYSVIGNPRVQNRNESGVLMCLNLISFALTSPRDDDV